MTNLQALGTAELSPGITPVSLHSQLYVGLVDCGGHWLDNYNWMDGQIEQDFHASLAVAKMIFNATLYDASALQRLSTITEVSTSHCQLLPSSSPCHREIIAPSCVVSGHGIFSLSLRFPKKEITPGRPSSLESSNHSLWCTWVHSGLMRGRQIVF